MSVWQPSTETEPLRPLRRALALAPGRPARVADVLRLTAVDDHLFDIAHLPARVGAGQDPRLGLPDLLGIRPAEVHRPGPVVGVVRVGLVVVEDVDGVLTRNRVTQQHFLRVVQRGRATHDLSVRAFDVNVPVGLRVTPTDADLREGIVVLAVLDGERGGLQGAVEGQILVLLRNARWVLQVHPRLRRPGGIAPPPPGDHRAGRGIHGEGELAAVGLVTALHGIREQDRVADAAVGVDDRRRRGHEVLPHGERVSRRRAAGDPPVVLRVRGRALDLEVGGTVTALSRTLGGLSSEVLGDDADLERGVEALGADLRSEPQAAGSPERPVLGATRGVVELVRGNVVVSVVRGGLLAERLVQWLLQRRASLGDTRWTKPQIAEGVVADQRRHRPAGVEVAHVLDLRLAERTVPAIGVRGPDRARAGTAPETAVVAIEVGAA